MFLALIQNERNHQNSEAQTFIKGETDINEKFIRKNVFFKIKKQQTQNGTFQVSVGMHVNQLLVKEHPRKERLLTEQMV